MRISLLARPGSSFAARAALLCSAGLFANPASAQETVAAIAPQTEVAPGALDEDATEVVVTGTRPIAESEAAALQIQRRSDSLVSVVASDAVGRLPDQNVAQAAGRLPGVAVQRDQGQARYITLRGAPINWTTLSIDGISIVSPEGRDTRYDSIPSAIASQIIVRKAVTPDMTGETVAGQVEIRTRSAFDYPGLHVAGKLGGGLAEQGNKHEYEGQLVVSDRLTTGIGDIGLLLSGSYYKRDMVTDNFETDWETVSQDRQPGGADRIWGRETENKLYRLTRKNYSYSGRFDWEPVKGNRIFLQSIFTTFTDDEARDNYIFDLDDRQADLTRPATPTCTPATGAASSSTNSGYGDICVNTPLVGTVFGIDINQRATLRAFEQSIFTNTLGGDHKLGETDAWALGWRLNYTRAKDDRSVVGEARYDSPSSRTSRPTVRYDFTDPQLARVELYPTLSSGGVFRAGPDRIRDIDLFPRTLTSLSSGDYVDITKAYTGKADLSRTFQLAGGEARFSVGGQFDQRTKEANESQLLINTAQAAALGIPTTHVGLNKDFLGAIPLGYDFRYFDKEGMRSWVKTADGSFDYVPIDANFYNVRERIGAGYAMGRIAYDWGSVLAGARVEHVANRGQAFVTLNGTSQLVTVNNDYTLIFPSAHLNVNVDETKKFRLSLNTGAARPDYDQLRPNFTFNDANLSVSGGNPEAKPERAFGLDGYLEWYTRPQGFAMIGAYYKKLDDVLFDDTRTFGLDNLNGGGVDRSQYTFSTIVNGGSGWIWGLEGAVQQQLEPYTAALGLPDFLGGFGLSANVNYNKSSATTPGGTKVPLPGTSKWVVNAGAYYEKYGLSMRLQYQYRSSWLDSLGAPADGGLQYWAADDELDFSARYGINRNVEVYFDASNLLNGAGRRYVRESKYTLEWERFGRRYTGGVRVNF